MRETVRVHRILAFAVLILAVPGIVQAASIPVTPSNMGAWAFDNRDVNGTVGANTTGTGQMVTGPAAPPLGTGSAELATGDGTIGGDGTWELRNTGFAGVKLMDLTALTYSTYMSTNNGQQLPYLGLMISTTGGSTPDDILFFEPPYQTPATGNPSLPDQGAAAMNTWQTWDALSGGWWDDNGNCNPGTGVTSLLSCIATFSDPVIVNTVDGLGGVRFNVGFADPANQFVGFVDNFTIGVQGVKTTFDFDPDATTAAVPEPASLLLCAGGLAMVTALQRRRVARR